LSFAQRAFKTIGWLQAHRVSIALVIILLEVIIGFSDFWVTEAAPITELHYITIALAAVIYDWAGVIAISLVATVSFFLSNFAAVGRPITQLTIPGIVLTLIIFLMIGASAMLILRLMTSLNLSNMALSDKLQQLQASRARIELLVSERERTRLARELHDGVAKTLLGVEYSAGALAQALLDNNTAYKKAIFIRDICHNEGQQLREVILDLRQGYKDPLFQLVSNYLQRWQIAYNSQTYLETIGSDENLDPNLVYEIMAILEEALENVQRHSMAGQVWVKIETNGELRMEIRDDGKGLEPDLLAYLQDQKTINLPNNKKHYIPQAWRGKDGRPRFGMIGMIERAEWLNGTLDLKQAPEGGLFIMVKVPIPG
jgi:signal transduction histidine kinase